MKKRPNIVYFVADQMRADSLAHMGNPASITPNFDKVLQEGVSFENAYCQNTVCVPSRISFLTGLYPHTTGHRTIHYLQNHGEPNILRTMKNNGYEVIWIGRNDVIPGERTKEEFCDRYYRAFGEGDAKYEVGGEFAAIRKQIKLTKVSKIVKSDEEKKKEQNTPGYYSFHVGKIDIDKRNDPAAIFAKYDWSCILQALDYIEEKSKNKDSKPFFLYVTLMFPHPDYMCEEPWYSSIDRSKLIPKRPSALELKGKASMLKSIAKKQNLHAWGEENFNDMRATYLAMVSRLDHQYGMVADKLKECGFYDDTSIFIFSDHGDYTGDYEVAEKVQNCFENPVSNVPLLIKPARQFDVKPRRSKALVELVDLTATVEAMTDVKTEYVNFGKSLLPVLSGEEQHKDAVFCEGGRIHGERWAMELGHGPESHYWPRLSTQASEGPEHTKAIMCRMGDLKYVYRLYEEDELYNLAEDPYELENMITLPQYQEKVGEMKLRILDWMVETADMVPDRQDLR